MANIFRKPCYPHRISTSSMGMPMIFFIDYSALEKKSLVICWEEKSSHHPSIDTGSVRCKHVTSTRPLSDLEDTVVLTVSVDLPFAQGKWCAAEGSTMLSCSQTTTTIPSKSLRPLDQ